MAETANALGVPATFTFQGKDYKVRDRSLRVEGQLERDLQAQDLAAVQSMRQAVRPDEYRMLLDGHRRDCASRVFSWGGEACVAYLSTVEGTKRLALLQLADGNPDDATVNSDLIDQIWDDPEAWERLTILFEAVAVDPNRKRAAK